MTNGETKPPDYQTIASRLKSGKMIPFFGAGASITSGFPSAKVLADSLRAAGTFPSDDAVDPELALIASYLVQKTDTVELHIALRQALGNIPAKPGLLHNCLAQLEAIRLFVTTNYDDLIESALEARRPWIVVDRGVPGRVSLREHHGKWKECDSKLLAQEIPVESKQPIVLKLHGSIDRQDSDNDSFLITEEDYVDFLGRPEGGQIPAMLATMMFNKSILFLGYALKDWNIRVLLRKLAIARNSQKITSWAIVKDLSLAEQDVWNAKNVKMHKQELDTFVSELAKWL